MNDLLDNPNILELINKYVIKKKNVLVHCKMGQQCSAIVIGYYLLRYFYLSSEEAIKYVKVKRPIAFLVNLILLIFLDFFEFLIVLKCS